MRLFQTVQGAVGAAAFCVLGGRGGVDCGGFGPWQTPSLPLISSTCHLPFWDHEGLLFSARGACERSAL